MEKSSYDRAAKCLLCHKGMNIKTEAAFPGHTLTIQPKLINMHTFDLGNSTFMNINLEKQKIYKYTFCIQVGIRISL